MFVDFSNFIFRSIPVQTNCNISTIQPVFTVPTGRSFIALGLVFHTLNGGSLTTAAATAGYNGTADNIIVSPVSLGGCSATTSKVKWLSDNFVSAQGEGISLYVKYTTTQSGLLHVTTLGLFL